VYICTSNQPAVSLLAKPAETVTLATRSMAKISNSKDILILLLGAKGPRHEHEPVRGITRLMKMTFLFNKELLKAFNSTKLISAAALPSFEAYDYGPFSNQVYTDLDFLKSMELVEEASEPFSTPGGEVDADPDDEKIGLGLRVITLSSLGKDYFQEQLRPQFSPQQEKLLHEFKVRCLTVPLKTLLRYVYQTYPDMTVNSKIKSQVLGLG
jgi:uncharacterized protein